MGSQAFLSTLLTCTLLAGWSHASDRHPLSSQHRKWLEEDVVYIIADSEKEAFLEAKSDEDREGLIEAFWALRDPDPSTEENEFEEELYSRIDYANQNFTEGRPGWKTERGRIYIMHGPPSDRSWGIGGDRIYIQVPQPTPILTEGLTVRGPFRLDLIQPEAELWTYRHIEGALSTKGTFQVIFARVNASQVHALHQAMRRVGYGANASFAERTERDRAIQSFLRSVHMGGDFQILYAGEYKFPDLEVLIQNSFDPRRFPRFSLTEFTSSLRDLDRSPGEVLHDKLRLRRRLREEVQTRVMFDRLDLALDTTALRSPSGSTLLHIVLGIPIDAGGDTLDLVTELLRDDGSSAVHAVHLIPVSSPPPENKNAQEPLLYRTRLIAQPGHYKLIVYGALRERGAATLIEKELDLPEFSSEGLHLSEILLFDQVLPPESPSDSRFLGGTQPIRTNNGKLVPAIDRAFRRKENLTIMFEVYNPEIDAETNNPAVQLTCRLWNGTNIVASMEPQLLNYVTDTESSESELKRTAYGLSVPLQSLHLGEHSFEAEVYDSISGQRTSRTVVFTIY